jgi:predicted nucleic acid-binding protein
MNVVSNSSPLISLGKLDMLFLLEKLFGKVIIPQAVYEEVVVKGSEEESKDAFHVAALIDQGIIRVEIVEMREDVLDKRLGRGEIEAIIFASRKKADVILMDDLLARIEARERNLKVKGTVGILYQAYCENFLGWGSFHSVIEEIVSRRDIWVHEDLCKEVLERARTLNHQI